MSRPYRPVPFPLAFSLVLLLAPAWAPEMLVAQDGTHLVAQHRKPATAKSLDPLQERLYPFYHGVASGDPLHDRVIIWTRVTPDSLAPGASIDVTWVVATDRDLAQVQRTGRTSTDSDRDYTVKIDVTGLESGRTYYYGFQALGRHSLTGRTKTTPRGNTADHLKFGVVSCSNFQAGYFNAYGRLADRNDLDAVIHLGDYIYEYADRTVGNPGLWEDRPLRPETEITSLFDYRARYSTYRLDTQLLRLHQQHPIISVWDDHESANNSHVAGADGHQPATEGPWADRKANSRRAYFEWLPIRDTGNRRIYRTIRYGDLADLILLDTRLEGRDTLVGNVNDPALYAEARTMLGGAQREWLFEQLAAAGARWKLIGNQVLFSPFNVGWAAAPPATTFSSTESRFLDIWDGYPAERTRITNYLRSGAPGKTVILSGDFHSSLACEVTDEPNVLDFRPLEPGGEEIFHYDPSQAYDPMSGAGAVAVEFVAPSVTAPNFDESLGTAAATAFADQLNRPIVTAAGADLGNPNPHLKMLDLTRHGYFLLDVRADTVQADWFYVPIEAPGARQAFGSGWRVAAPGNTLRPVSTPAPARGAPDLPAPAEPPGPMTGVRTAGPVTLLAVAPNPTSGAIHLQYAHAQAGPLRISLLGPAGRELRLLYAGHQPPGLYSLRTDLGDLPAGTYLLRLATPAGMRTQRVILHR